MSFSEKELAHFPKQQQIHYLNGILQEKVNPKTAA
jgi:hypothetical protein